MIIFEINSLHIKTRNAKIKRPSKMEGRPYTRGIVLYYEISAGERRNRQ